MIANNDSKKQLPTEIKTAFDELNILKHLRHAGITKNFGYTCGYLFRLIFCLIFTQKNWFRLLESQKAKNIPGKDTVYRFLNHSKFNWRRFLLAFSAATIQKVSRLTNHKRDYRRFFISSKP